MGADIDPCEFIASMYVAAARAAVRIPNRSPDFIGGNAAEQGEFATRIRLVDDGFVLIVGHHLINVFTSERRIHWQRLQSNHVCKVEMFRRLHMRRKSFRLP